MKLFEKAIFVLLVAALILPMLAYASGEVESRPAEKAAERLFNKGIGSAWVGGEPFGSSVSTEPDQTPALRPFTSFQIVGYLDVENGFSLLGDTGEGLHLMGGKGSYPVYAYYEGDKLVGLFVDLGSSSGIMRMSPYL